MKKVKVPLSKLHFEIYNPEDGEKINMGDGVIVKSTMWQAWTDKIDKLDVISVEFPKFSYESDSVHVACAILTVYERNDTVDRKLPSEVFK